MRFFLAAVLVLFSASRGDAAVDLDPEALCAYGAGRFVDAAVGFARAEMEPSTAPAASYFLGRSLRELGLDSPAETALARAAGSGDRLWRELARRELARVAFEQSEPDKAIELLAAAGGSDSEVRYFAGLAAARERRWSEAIDLLGGVAASEPRYPYARYARAQASAANGDFIAALADLEIVIANAPAAKAASRGSRLESRELLEPIGDENGMLRAVFVPTTSAVPLADRAELLRGKILYVEGRLAEARAAFAAVRRDGPMAVESARGLLLTGDVEEAAARGDRHRPAETAMLRLSQAYALEQSGDLEEARRVRTALRVLVRDRLAALDGFVAHASVAHDLMAFAAKLELARAESRWPDEEKAAEISCSFGPVAPASLSSFRPSDEIFYDLWDQLRGNRRLASLLDIGGASARLERDAAWELRMPEGGRRARRQLLKMRLSGLEIRATDEGIPALASYVGPTMGTGSPARTESGAGEDGLASLRARNQALGKAISAELERAIGASLHARKAFFERVDADNEGSLSRLYARDAGGSR